MTKETKDKKTTKIQKENKDYKQYKLSTGEKDINGKAIRKSFYGKTLREAKNKAREWELEQDRIKHEKEYKKEYISFKEVSDSWLEVRSGLVQYKTYKGYEYKVKAMQDYFKCGARDIGQEEIQKYLNTFKGKPFNTVNKHRILLKSIFDFAVYNDYADKNPCQYAKMPKCQEPKKRKYYSMEDARLVVDVAKKAGTFGLCVFIPLKTGMRPGEVVALNIDRDLDLKNNMINVNETVKFSEGGQTTGDPKTKTSKRTIPVDKEFVEHLTSLGLKGYVYDNGKGKPKSYSAWKKYNFDVFMASLQSNENTNKLEILDPHELRHTYGTILYQSGTDFYTIMKVMGHANIDVTQIYVHHDPNSIRDKMNLDF